MKRIVIADTDLETVNLIKNVLELENYEVFNASSTEEAIILIEEKKPSLVVIDVEINIKNDKIALGNYLLKQDTVPYIYMSKETTTINIDIAKKTRPYGFLMKPIRIFDLVTTITFLLNNFSHRKIDIVRQEFLMPDIATVAVKKAIDYINNNYTKDITLEQLGELTKRDKTYLCRSFRERMNITPHQYILKLRIDEAITLLDNTDDSLLSITKKLGFSTYGHFYHTFKKNTGYTPSNYRNIKNILKG